MMNPYLKEFIELWGETNPDVFKNMQKGHDDLYGFEMREDMIFRYSFAIPDEKALHQIMKYEPIIEIGAGTGYWASLLSQASCDITAYDNHEEDRWTYKHFTVKIGNENSINKHPERTLFVCWPDNALPFLEKYEGEYFIYIGECYGGCTGGKDFFDYLDEHFEKVFEYKIPQWPGVHDYLEIYRRNKNGESIQEK